MEGPEAGREEDIPASGWEASSHSHLFSPSSWGGSWGSALSRKSSPSSASLDDAWNHSSLLSSDDVYAIKSDDEAMDTQLRSAKPNQTFPGLFNLGNTCFLNSILQCLTYTPPFVDYVKNCSHKSSCLTKGFCAMCAIENHVKDVASSSGTIVSPVCLADNLSQICKSFVLGDQQDAHEFFLLLTEALQKCFEPARCTETKGSRSFISNIFIGQLRSRVECSRCAQSSDTFEDFLSLSLEVESCNTVVEALQNFTKVEALEEDSHTICEYCKHQIKRTKQMTFEKPPQVLAIHLKRFKASSVLLSKIESKVEYEISLDIMPFMSKGPSQIHIQESDHKYSLYAVLVHSGWSLSCGHFFCYVKTSSGTWHCMNDSLVSKVCENIVLHQEAYILFYIREDLENAYRIETEPSAVLFPRNSKVLTSSTLERPRMNGDLCSISAAFSATSEVEATICAEAHKSKSIVVPKESTPLEKQSGANEGSKQAQNTTSSSLKARSSMQQLPVKDERSETAKRSLRGSGVGMDKPLDLLNAGKVQNIPDSFQLSTQQSFHRVLNHMPSSRRHALLASAMSGHNVAKHASSPANKDACVMRSFQNSKSTNPARQQYSLDGKGGNVQISGDLGKRQERDYMQDKPWTGEHSTDLGGRKVQRVGEKRIMASFVDLHT